MLFYSSPLCYTERMKLPDAFLNRMRRQLGGDFPAYVRAMEQTPRRALRVNTLKIAPEALPALLGIAPEPCGVIPEGFLVPEGFAPGRHPLHAAGLFYMQEPSAQLPASLLDLQPGEAVLDLCAAPGGKSGQIAAGLQNTGLLVANEIVPSRATVLQRTLERLGVRNAVVTSMRPDALCQALAGCFDAVLADAPCSGEGMFRREPQAVADWSEAHVAACAVRQRAILDSAALALRPGGRLVYSTCTFSPEENEQTVEAFLQAHPDFSLAGMHHLYPHTSTGEGQFAALLRRAGDGAARTEAPRERPVREWEAFCRDAMTHTPEQPARLLPDGRVFLLPERLPPALDKLRVLQAGVPAGEIRNGRFQPAHALFLAYERAAFQNTVELGGAALSAYLAGEAIPCTAPGSGYAAVCAQGYPLGFGKLTGGTLKNHLPKGLRMR